MKVERVYIGCCASDVWLARICVASIRYWYPEIPICLLRDDSRGQVDTHEIEQFWSVEVRDSGKQFSGWSFTKVELFFQQKRERFLWMDADMVMVGPLLDAIADRTEDFLVSPDEIDDPLTHSLLEVYFDYPKLREFDPEYRFPGFVFNAGQFIATSGILSPADFEPAVEWSTPLQLTRRDLFFCSEQGLLNYLFVRQSQTGALTLGTAPLYYDGLATQTLELDFRPPDRGNPHLIHWPGDKKPLPGLLSRGDILTFFEQHYYSRIPGGFWKRHTRAAARYLRFLRKRIPLFFYGFVPESGRRFWRKLRDRPR